MVRIETKPSPSKASCNGNVNFYTFYETGFVDWIISGVNGRSLPNVSFFWKPIFLMDYIDNIIRFPSE